MGPGWAGAALGGFLASLIVLILRTVNSTPYYYSAASASPRITQDSIKDAPLATIIKLPFDRESVNLLGFRPKNLAHFPC